MNRISHDVALCCVLILLLPAPCFSDDLPVSLTPAASTHGEICFPLPDGDRILQQLETAQVCREAVTACEDALRSEGTRSISLEKRVVEQEKELKDARKLVDDTRKAGEDAVKASSGPWYQQMLKAAKWIALGIAIGFVGGMSK